MEMLEDPVTEVVCVDDDELTPEVEKLIQDKGIVDDMRTFRQATHNHPAKMQSGCLAMLQAIQDNAHEDLPMMVEARHVWFPF